MTRANGVLVSASAGFPREEGDYGDGTTAGAVLRDGRLRLQVDLVSPCG